MLIDKAQKRAQVFYEYQGEVVVVFHIYECSEDSSFGQNRKRMKIVNEFIGRE